jgi:hypothetical protein
MERGDLGELFRKHGSDKDRNGYTALYHSLFKNIRSRMLVILEIGVGCTQLMGHEYEGHQGASLKAWAEYFPNAVVFGTDVEPEAINLSFMNGRVTTHYCDSTNISEVKAFAERIRKQIGVDNRSGIFDIIIDDGSHLQVDQLKTLHNLFPYLKHNGYYIIEDIGGDVRNEGYQACPVFHPPRPIVQQITNNSHAFVVHDWNPTHNSAVMVITK